MSTLRPELSGVERAIRRAGGVDALASHLKRNRTLVVRWRARGWVTRSYAEEISRLTSVPVDELVRKRDLTGIGRAITQQGGLTKLAKALGCDVSTVISWRVCGQVSTLYVQAVSDLTGISVQDLIRGKKVSGIVRAISRAKGQARLAAHLGRSVPLISKWKKRGWVPSEHAQAISDLTGIPVADLINPEEKYEEVSDGS